jgi:hypothetical protein
MAETATGVEVRLMADVGSDGVEPAARDRIDKVPFREDPDRLGPPVFDDQRTYAFAAD